MNSCVDWILFSTTGQVENFKLLLAFSPFNFFVQIIYNNLKNTLKIWDWIVFCF